jgi:hypothetical protein
VSTSRLTAPRRITRRSHVHAQQLAQARQLAEDSAGTRLGPAVDGLRHIIAGGQFSADGTVPGGSGRRFLGWARGPHWYLQQPSPS